MKTFPKARIDALTDGIFAFAMTLLVLEIRLPPDAVVKDSAELLARLQALVPEYLVYIISFFVLAAQWRVEIGLRRVEEVSQEAVSWSIVYLFFITSVPFSSGVVGRHGDLPPAVWLYAANMIAAAAVSLRLRALEVVPEHRARARADNIGTAVFIASALLSVALSFIEPRHAMYAYFLNFLAVPLSRWRGRGE
ncbi:TMEM175 family protein [Pseudolabrys sp. FHR47]|uniref:TMEM175 family protein n=1 Tax=Pseudolabrys sp. FHR47 TaxID=2562284 RepID=UPI0010BF3FF3|nr:TMEM175 family protein [Pseudolabrys sp. FHR47]